MTRLRRSTLLVALTGGLAALALLAPSAMAHADLMSAEPQPNTELDQAPGTLLLDFSEPLEDTYTSVELLDGNQTDHVERFQIPEDHRDHLEAELAPLEDGVYTVQWQALSSSDGHTTTGSYLLAVNASLTDTGQAPPGGDGSTPRDDGEDEAAVGEGGPGEALLRGVGFLGGSLAAGIPFFLLVAHGIRIPSTVQTRWFLTGVAGALLAAVASLGLVVALGGRIGGSFQTALSTTPGENLLYRSLAFAGSALLVSVGMHERGEDHGVAFTAAGTLTAIGGLLLTSLGSHAAAEGVGSGLAILVDWTHQASVAFWVSGVTALGIAGLSRTPEASGARLIRRFSPLAVASVAIIVVTGLWASMDRLTSVSDLVGSLYGFALSAKVLLLGPLLALGAYHRYWLLPQLETPGDEARDVSLLRRSAFVELGLMVVVLVAAGFMATTSPPTPPEEAAPYATFEDAMEAETPGPFSPELDRSQLESLTASEAENITLKLLVPDRVDRLSQGDQPVWILAADQRSGTPAPITDASIEIQAWMPEHGHGTDPETHPRHIHDGMYEGSTHWMMGGSWDLRFNVSLPDGDVLHYEITTYVGEKADPLDAMEPTHAYERDGFRVEVFLSPEPVKVGVQNLTVRVTPEEPVFPENADVVVNLDAPSGSGEGTSVDLDRWREDAWSVEDAVFTEQGEWSVLVAFQGKETYVQDDFRVDVGPP